MVKLAAASLQGGLYQHEGYLDGDVVMEDGFYMCSDSEKSKPDLPGFMVEAENSPSDDFSMNENISRVSHLSTRSKELCVIGDT